MNRLALAFAAVTGCLAVGGGAAAAAPIRIYDIQPFLATTTVVSGQIVTPKSRCESHRRFKVAAKSGNAWTVLDYGRTSREGAFAGYFRTGKLARAGRAYVSAAPVGRCAGMRTSLRPLDDAKSAARSRHAVATQVAIIGVNGIGRDGAASGIIALTPKADCFQNRSIRLMGDGTPLDSGSTTRNGGWALHLTHREAQRIHSFTVKVAGATASGRHCLAAKETTRELG